MIEKTKTALWFAQRPSHWAHGAALARRKLLPNHDDPTSRAQARCWAAERTVSVADGLSAVGLQGKITSVDPSLIAEGRERAWKSEVKMGGAGDLDLLYNAVRLQQASRVVETGVAYGWSSLAILSAFENLNSSTLISVDMPYPKLGNEAFVGIVVPERLRAAWTLVREPDKRGLEKALTLIGGTIDLCHYDSDKSWWGRHYAFPLLWKALRPGGIFISDDIQDNMYFAEFISDKRVPFAVTESQGKYVGIARKPV